MSVKLNNKVLIIFGVVALSIACVLFLFIGRVTKINLYFENVDKKSENQIISYFEKLDKVKVLISDELEESDLYFSYTDPLLNSDDFKPIDLVDVTELPTSMRALGLTENKNRIGLPLQIDHIELLINKSLVNFEDGKETFSNIAELEEILLSYVEPGYFPLMISGKNNSALLDLIFLLTVSYYGEDGYNSLVEYINNGLTEDLSQLNTILDLIIKWRREGILHPEWLNFDKEAVLSFLEDELSIATILRLSEHRKLPLTILRQHEAIPFPLFKESIYASDTALPTLFCSLLKNSKLKEGKIDLILSGLLKKEFQNKLTFASGLAPVNSTSSTMDKQASDVRFWAAASGNIIPVNNLYYSYSDTTLYLEIENYDIFLNMVREYLLVNR